MSDQAQNNNQQVMMIGLAVIAALLAVIVGVLVFQGRSNSVPIPTQVPTQQTAPTDAGATGGTTGGTTGGNTGAPAVDPAAATKVPKGTEPAAFVKSYYESCAKGDWEAAYKALPADKQAGQTPEGLKTQVEGYAVQSYSVSEATVSGDQATVLAEQVTAGYGTFVNTWTFAKKDGVWYVASKAVTGMK